MGEPSAPVRLHRHIPVLLRPGGRIQFGADPHRCLIFPLPDGIAPGPVFAALLSSTRGACLVGALAGSGLPERLADALLAELDLAGLIETPRRDGRITVIGRDVLRHRVVDALRARGATPASRLPGPDTRAWLTSAPTGDIGTVVLTGFEVPDVPLLAVLRGRGIPYLNALLCDGAGVIGPWVPTPSAPCPACAEAHRLDEDPARAVLALQLAAMIPCAPPETVTATAAAVLAQLAEPSALYGTQAVIDPVGLRFSTSPLLPHPACPVCAAGRRERRNRGDCGDCGHNGPHERLPR